MGKATVYFVTGFAAIGGFLFGYDIGVISGVIANKYWKDYFNNPNDALTGGVVSSFTAGCFVSALLMASWLADTIGRKRSIIVGSLIFTLGGALQAAANSVAMLIVGRIFSGLAIGILSMMVPLYQSELSPPAIRGRLISLQQWAITIGIMVAFWIGYGCDFILSDTAWRLQLGIQCIPAVICAVGCIFLPYSPRWLMDKGRDEEGLRVLATLHGNGDVNHPVVQQEFNEIKDVIRAERENSVRTYAELFRGGPGGLRRRMILGIFIQIFQQLTGMNSIMYYAPEIFQTAGIVGDRASLLATGVNGVVNMLFTIPAILYVDSWGRRKTLIFGALSMGTCMLVLAILIATALSVPAAAYICMVLVFGFVGSFAISWGPVGWIYPAEIYPLHIRAKATSLTTAANWLFNFVIGQICLTLIHTIGWGMFVIFAVFGYTMATCVYFFYPETKGKTLEEMDVVFGTESIRADRVVDYTEKKVEVA